MPFLCLLNAVYTGTLIMYVGVLLIYCTFNNNNCTYHTSKKYWYYNSFFRVVQCPLMINTAFERKRNQAAVLMNSYVKECFFRSFSALR